MKTITIIIITCLNITYAIAQTNYYENTKTIYENGYTYQCDVPAWKLVTLYNKENKLTYEDIIYKATGKYYSPDPGEYIDTFEDDNWTKQLCHSIVDNAFLNIDKNRLKGQELSITMFIDPITGKVMEVNFTFTTFSPYATIPVSIYRKIETEIKSNIWFIPTNEGKKLNYIMLSWDQEPKVIPPPKPATPQWNNDLAIILQNFAPTYNYGDGSSFNRPKMIYPGMFNFTDESGAFNANTYISGAGKAMVEFYFHNQTNKDIELNTSKISARLDHNGIYISPEITEIFTYNNGRRISIKNQSVIIPAEGGNMNMILYFNDILQGFTWSHGLYDLKMNLFYENKSMLNYIVDERYDWVWDDEIEAVWYRAGYIMIRYMYNTGKQEMYYNKTTGQYFY